MTDIGPYSNYRLTVRLELANKPGMFARVAAVLAEEGANLGAVDIVSATAECMVRDVTFDVQDETHGEKVLARLGALPDVKVLSASDRIFLLHLGGKIQVQSKFPITTRNVLSMVYTPGVGRVSQAIAKDKTKAYAFTSKSNTVAVVTDGSAVLGLGNLGPEAALPVMEGKAMLFKEFAGIDAWPICLNTQDSDEIVRTVQAIAPGFGAINLEDISSPRCFEIERRLKSILDIPVMHDDQHGTAVVILAALDQCAHRYRKTDGGHPPGRQWSRRRWNRLLQNAACCWPLSPDRMRTSRYRLTRGWPTAAGLSNGSGLLHDQRPSPRHTSRCPQGG